jgi:hypothetical protein
MHIDGLQNEKRKKAISHLTSWSRDANTCVDSVEITDAGNKTE